MKVFQNRYYYVKEMKGSYSIKNVLPALVPELTYDDLEISDGGMAMLVFAQLKNIDNKKEIKRIKNNLLEYCKMDTLAMVKIIDKLRKAVDY